MKLFIDYDTTLVNLIDPWVDWINKKYHVNILASDINRWYYLSEVFGEEANDFWKSEKYNHYTDRDIYQPYEGAIDFFHKVQKMFGQDNVYIISSSRDHHVKEKIQHAKHYFDCNEKNFIPVKRSKFGLTKEGILIDDYPLHVMEHIHYNNQHGIVFNFKNRFGWCRESNYLLDITLNNFLDVTKNEKFQIMTSYDEIIKVLSTIKKKEI